VSRAGRRLGQIFFNNHYYYFSFLFYYYLLIYCYYFYLILLLLFLLLFVRSHFGSSHLSYVPHVPPRVDFNCHSNRAPMSHKHSHAARKVRYERAVARGYIVSQRPIGLSTTSGISHALPGPLRKQFRVQMNIAQVAIAAHLLVAASGYVTDNLGKAYQVLRTSLPDFLAGGLRRLNRAYCRVRHNPLATTLPPAGFGFVRMLRNALGEMSASEDEKCNRDDSCFDRIEGQDVSIEELVRELLGPPPPLPPLPLAAVERDAAQADEQEKAVPCIVPDATEKFDVIKEKYQRLCNQISDLRKWMNHQSAGCLQPLPSVLPPRVPRETMCLVDDERFRVPPPTPQTEVPGATLFKQGKAPERSIVDDLQVCDDVGLYEGEVVRFSGLSAKSELNGRLGLVTGYHADKGRFSVVAFGYKQEILVRPCNLNVRIDGRSLDPTLLKCGICKSGDAHDIATSCRYCGATHHERVKALRQQRPRCDFLIFYDVIQQHISTFGDIRNF